MKSERLKSMQVSSIWFAAGFVALAVPTIVSAHSELPSPISKVDVSSQKISSGNRFQAVDILDEKTIFISGTNSSIYKSENAGLTWSKLAGPAEQDKLQFRDVYVDQNSLVLMSAGEGSSSRIYASNDEGESWTLTHKGVESTDFYNCITKANDDYWLFGDSVGSRLTVLKSAETPYDWKTELLPFNASDLEGGFASSGTCINSNNKGDIVIGTGNTASPRILLKDANNWQSISSPFKGGEAAGIFSVQLSDNHIYAFGGTLKSKDKPASAFVYNRLTKNWKALPTLPMNGAIYGASINQGIVFATSPDGIAMLEAGHSEWQLISSLDMWAIDCSSSYCLAVGGDDTVIKISFN